MREQKDHSHDAMLPETHRDPGSVSETSSGGGGFTSIGEIPKVSIDDFDHHPSTASERAYIGDGAGTETATKAKSSKSKFKTVMNTDVEQTSRSEASLLNEMRAYDRRLDPVWLMAAQTKLGVGDASGAMNTETLRKLIEEKKAQLGANAKASEITSAVLLEEGFLQSLYPGQPFASPAKEWLHHSDKNPDAKHDADRAAQAVGYEDFDDYQSELLEKDSPTAPVDGVTFLGVSLAQGRSDGRAHPYLVERLRVAEAYLHQRHGKDNATVIKKIGWNGSGGLGYENKGKDITGYKPPKGKEAEEVKEKSHQHTMGLAIDIDPGHNPYVFDGGAGHNEWMDKHLEIAHGVFGGTKVSNASLQDWSKQGSTEELHAKVASGNSAFVKWLELCKKDESEIKAKLMESYEKDETKAAAIAKDAKAFEPWYHSAGFHRDKAQGLTNINMDLLIALRDVAGLNWGGTEMSHTQNGDFMHFDCRNTEFGRAVVDKEAPADRAKRLEAEKQKRQPAKHKK